MTVSLSPEKRDAILDAIRRGASIKAAAHLADIPSPTLYGWLRKGREEPEGPYGLLVTAVAKAQAELEARLAESWLDKCDVDWKASAEYLRRRYPEEWAGVQEMSISVEQKRGAEDFDRMISDLVKKAEAD